jgi:hypothetical protein
MMTIYERPTGHEEIIRANVEIKSCLSVHGTFKDAVDIKRGGARRHLCRRPKSSCLPDAALVARPWLSHSTATQALRRAAKTFIVDVAECHESRT